MPNVVSESQRRQASVVSGVTGIRRAFEIVSLILDGSVQDSLVLSGESVSILELGAYGSGVTASVVQSTQTRQASLMSGRVSTVGIIGTSQIRQRSISYSYDVKGLVTELQSRQLSASYGGGHHGEALEEQGLQVSAVQGEV